MLICKRIFLNFKRPNSMRLPQGWALGSRSGAQRAVAGGRGHLCRWLQLYTLSSALQMLWVSYLFQGLLPLPMLCGCVRIILPPQASKSSERFSTLWGVIQQPRAAEFTRPVENTGLQCTVRVPELFPEAFPSLRNGNATGSPLLVFGEPLNYCLHLDVVVV